MTLSLSAGDIRPVPPLISSSLNAAASRDEPEAAVKERKSSRQLNNPTNSRIFNAINRGMLVAMETPLSSH